MAAAQLVVDTTRTIVGASTAVVVRLQEADALPAGRVTLGGTLRLSNPTVFFPQRFLAPSGSRVLESSLVAEKDSIYNFSLTLERDSAGDTLFVLGGEALAASDSLCILRFEDLSLAGSSINDASGVVISRSVGPPLPYIRFATLEQNYPNPVPSGTTTAFAYRIDRRSEVTFHIYNVLGQELVTEQLGEQPLGPHIFVFVPYPTMPTGAYLVRMVTNSGSADKVMHILR